ncbi:hypothetical protein [Haloarchaeobius iranensis]|uniref:Uncharacterized protein n=1 Tax=Haloarchaeobius iranensis TaxID=996166 RepID=A0A1G9TTL1_9EURY|nr:hypothetical protein [Haloarchaeobius iranensis]SDM50888.1 hypothetical protein SAMN05192554_103116 [Haloarchaeobius iranensis]
MTDRDRRERLTEYVAVLREFGRSDDEILAAHDEESLPDGVSLPEFLDHRFDHVEESTLYERLHDALATGPAGIDAEREYWAHAPARQLDDACRAHGWRVDLSGEDPITITAETPDGEPRESRFTYPPSDLGQHNYPALAAAVAELLDGLTFALLTDRDGRWRFVCVETGRLATLRERYGERVRVFRRPLLRAEQPADFAAAADREAHDRGSELAGVAGDAFAESMGTGPRVHRSSRPLDTEMDVDAGPETVVGEGIDEVFETIDADAGADQSDGSSANERVDDDVETLLSDLDEPTRSAAEDGGEQTVARSNAAEPEDDRESGADGSAGLVGGGPKTTVVEDGLDEVFAGLEEANPPVRETAPERMATDDVLDSVEAEPGEAESTDQESGDAAPVEDGPAEQDTADAAEDETDEEVVDAPSEPADGQTPVLDPDELTTPEQDAVAPVGSPGSTEAGDEEPEAGDEPVPDEPATRSADVDTVDPAAEAPATIADDDDDTGADAEALADLASGSATETPTTEAETPTTEEPTPPATEAPGEMDDSFDDGEPEASPSIDEVDLGVDESDIPDVDGDEETSTAGPLAGSVAPHSSTATSDERDGSATGGRAADTAERPDISPDDPVGADLLADPDESSLADVEHDDEYDDVIVGRLDDEAESERGPFGRLAAWLRNLF